MLGSEGLSGAEREQRFFIFLNGIENKGVTYTSLGRFNRSFDTSTLRF
jgi:hypothetical protein